MSRRKDMLTVSHDFNESELSALELLRDNFLASEDLAMGVTPARPYTPTHTVMYTAVSGNAMRPFKPAVDPRLNNYEAPIAVGRMAVEALDKMIIEDDHKPRLEEFEVALPDLSYPVNIHDARASFTRQTLGLMDKILTGASNQDLVTCMVEDDEFLTHKDAKSRIKTVWEGIRSKLNRMGYVKPEHVLTSRSTRDLSRFPYYDALHYLFPELRARNLASVPEYEIDVTLSERRLLREAFMDRGIRELRRYEGNTSVRKKVGIVQNTSRRVDTDFKNLGVDVGTVTPTRLYCLAPRIGFYIGSYDGDEAVTFGDEIDARYRTSIGLVDNDIVDL